MERRQLGGADPVGEGHQRGEVRPERPRVLGQQVGLALVVLGRLDRARRERQRQRPDLQRRLGERAAGRSGDGDRAAACVRLLGEADQAALQAGGAADDQQVERADPAGQLPGQPRGQ
ncbi:hypothetical protein ACFQ1I_18320 [Kitasatospora arboriphila]